MKRLTLSRITPPEVVRNYLKELGGIALYNAIFGNPHDYYSYQSLHRAIIRYEIPREDYANTCASWSVYCACAEEARNRKNGREKILKEQYKILFDLDTSASRKTFEQILAHDNEWSFENKELTSCANNAAKRILHEACRIRGYYFE